MTDNGNNQQARPGNPGTDPALLDALRQLTTSLDRLGPLLQMQANITGAPGSSGLPQLRPRDPNALRDSAPVEPTAADVLRWTAPTEARLDEFAKAVRDAANSYAGLWRLPLLVAANPIRRWPRSFGNLVTDDGGTLTFLHDPDFQNPERRRGAAHDLDAQGYPTVTPIAYGQDLVSTLRTMAS